MRRGMVMVAVIVTILAGIGIGVGAYRAGEERGITQGIEQVQVAQESGQEVQVVHVVGDGRRGFFPGFFLFPLFVIGGFFLVGALFRRGRWGRGPWGGGPGPWNDEGGHRFEERAREWHRHEHGESTPPGAPPAQAAGA